MSQEWGTVRLGDVCGFQNGFAFKSKLFKPSGIPVLRISSIQDELVSDNRPVFTDPNDYKEDLSRYEVHDGDLLIAMSGATTGKIGFNRTGTTFLQNQRVGKFIPSNRLSIDFLFFYLLTKVEDNLKVSAGAAQPNLSTKQIKDFLIPLPPLPQQKRIVAILDEAFAGITQAVTNADKNLANARELFESYLNSVFTQKGEGWVERTLEEECDILMGQSPAGTSYNTDGEGVPLINGPVEFGGIDSFSKTVATKFTTKPTKMCETGDLILCVRGSTTGRMNIAGQNACIGRGVAAIRSSKNQDWVNRFISFSRQNIYDLGSGSTFPNVSASVLKKIVIPFPPKQQRGLVIEKIETLGSKTQQLETIYQQKLSTLAELKQSILQKVFTGELTTKAA